MKISPGLSCNKTLVIALAVVALVLSIVLLYVQVSALLNLRAEVAQEEAALDLAVMNRNRLLAHQRNEDEYRQRLAFTEKMIPPGPEEEFILRYIHYLTEEYDLRAVEIRFDNRVETEEYTAMPLVFTLEGGYSALGRLLWHLRESPERAIRIDSVRLSRGAGSGAPLSIVLSGSAFYNPGN